MTIFTYNWQCFIAKMRYSKGLFGSRYIEHVMRSLRAFVIVRFCCSYAESFVHLHRLNGEGIINNSSLRLMESKLFPFLGHSPATTNGTLNCHKLSNKKIIFYLHRVGRHNFSVKPACQFDRQLGLARAC